MAAHNWIDLSQDADTGIETRRANAFRLPPHAYLVLNNSARYGLRAALPIILGACAGAAGIVLLGSTWLSVWV